MSHLSRTACAWRPGLILALLGLAFFVFTGQQASLGDFEAETDVGDVQHKGSVQYNPRTQQYQITGSGRNMWETEDAFHFVWRQLSGDLVLNTSVAFLGTGQEHRKAGWIVRQSLEADSPYADAIVHADGLISLQYRQIKGGPTLEVQSSVKAAWAGVQLERNGDLFTLRVARPNEVFQPVGSVTVALRDPVYAGLGVCSHDENAVATAVFFGVHLVNPGPVPESQRILESSLETIAIDPGERRIVYSTRDHIEAPNWSRDGKFFVYNSEGRLYTLVTQGGEPHLLNTGNATHCNNDHGFSPDGKWLAISHEPKDDSLIYVLPSAGGEPRQITTSGPSYWHSWSPDGKILAYCAERQGEFDIYTVSAQGGKETRLTTASGLDDGPDYSPDGGTLYFNSERTGHMKIWRMNTDGSGQQQVTFDDQYVDWFPHPSPDGRWLVFLSYDKSVKGHPPNKDVALRIMPLTGSGELRTLARLFGGQGTINVPSWSPDSQSFAFVSYRLVKP